jgi:flagellar biosynthesis/type III secretory pathway chaperone
LIGQGILTVVGKIQAAFDYVFGTNFANNIDDAKRKLEELRQVANQQFVNRVGERDQARRDRIEELSKAKDDTLAELERERQRRQGQLAGAGSEAVDDAQRKLDEAFAAYRKTVDDAAARQAAASTTGLDEVKKKQQDALANIFDGLDETAAATPSRAGQAIFGGTRAAQIFGDVQDAQLTELKGIRQTLRDSLTEQKKKPTGLVITS